MTAPSLLATVLALLGQTATAALPDMGRAPDPCAESGYCADQLVDPGTGPWIPVPADEVREACRLDPELLEQVTPPDGASFAVVRYGRLCFVSGRNGSDGPEVGHVFSVTKTLGALMTGMVMYETRHIPPTDETGRGPLRVTDRMDKWIDLDALPGNARIHPDATVAHVLAMVGYNESLAYGEKTHRYDATGNREINYLIRVIDNVVKQDPERLGADAVAVKDRLFEKLGLEHSSWDVSFFGYSWYASLLDLARVGLVILNGGVYDGERLVDAGYIYDMTRPAFEDASTRYGYLTWLNTMSCAPSAVHAAGPRTPSGTRACPTGDCDQEYDVGAWSANGAGGQFIIGHRGLDLVIVGRNWQQTGANALWQAVLPAIVAEDPAHRGNQDGFCDAYAASAYAPDLRKWEGNR